LLFGQQSFAFTTKPFALVTILNGSEVLLRRKDETAGEKQSTEQ
jgi:hypothetical protein